MKKRRHHYVWQHYLRAWATDGSIWCQRAGKRFKTGTETVAVRNDFYRLREMSERDIAVVELLISRMTPPLQVLAKGWISMFRVVHDLKRLHDATGGKNPEVEQKLDEAISNLEEDMHAFIEGGAVPLLESLRNGDPSALYDDERFLQLSFFIGMQYMRTTRLKAKTLAAGEGVIAGFSMESAFGLLRTIFATNIGHGLYVRRQSARITFLEPAAEAEFVTGDQPVINLRAVALDEGAPATELELYYPVQPRRALLLNFDAAAPTSESKRLTTADTLSYNKMIVSMSHEQVYGRTQEALLACQ